MAIEIRTVEAPDATIERNLKREAAGRCLLCRAPMTPSRIARAVFVHVGDFGGTILAAGERSASGQDEDGAGGQGMFPVGPECAKRVPREYRQAAR